METFAFPPVQRESPTYNSRPGLYNIDPSIRYKAAGEFHEETPEFRLRWPYGSWGSANPWLVLLGPSPGNDLALKRTFDADPWANSNSVGYGPGACEVEFADGQPRRNRNWLALRRAAFSAVKTEAEADVLQKRLTAIMNLSHENAACALRGAAADEMRTSGCKKWLFPQLESARPAVIIVLSKAAWVPFFRALNEAGKVLLSLDPAPHSKARRNKMERLLIQTSADLPYPTAVIHAPVHPSMGFSIGMDDVAVRAGLLELLAEQSKHFTR